MDNVESLKKEVEDLIEERKYLLDLCWLLYQSLDPDPYNPTVKACVALIEKYGFDPEELPEDLYEAVKRHIWESNDE